MAHWNQRETEYINPGTLFAKGDPIPKKDGPQEKEIRMYVERSESSSTTFVSCLEAHILTAFQ